MAKESLTTEQLAELATELQYAFEDSVEAGSARAAMVADYRDQYEGELVGKPHDWQCNVNMPLTSSHIDNVAIAIADVVGGSEPIFQVDAMDPADDDAAHQEEEFMQYWNERMRFKTKLHTAVREALITGESWLKAGIERTGKELPSAVGRPLRLDELDTKPTCDVVVFEDQMLLPFNAACFAASKGAFARTWVRWSTIMKAAKGGVISSATVETLRTAWESSPAPTQQEASAGVNPQRPRSIWEARFECWEGVYRYPRPGTEDEIEWLVLFYYPLTTSGGGGAKGEVLKCVPYEPVFGSKWLFTPIIVDRLPNSLHGRSMCKGIAGLQQLLNANVNQAVDAITMSIMPPIAVGTSSRRTALKWAPMEQWPLAAQDVQVLGGSAAQASAIAQSMSMNEFLRQMTERQTGMSDPAMGKQSTKQTTAFEINAVIDSGSRKFNWQVCTVQLGTEEGEGLEGYAEMLLEIFRRFLPAYPIMYRSNKGGNRGASTIDPQAHNGSYQIFVHGNSAASNPQLRMQRAKMILEAMGSCPLVQFSALDSLEVIIAKSQGMYKSWSEFLLSMGEKHPESYIGGEPATIEEAMAIVMVSNPQVGIQIATREQAKQQQVAAQSISQQTGLPPEAILQLAATQAQGGIPGGAGGPAGVGGAAVSQPTGQAGMVPV